MTDPELDPSALRELLGAPPEWRSLEEYIEREGDRRVSHGMCPECDERMMRELGEKVA